MSIIDARYYKTLLICSNRPMAAELGPLLAAALPLAPVQEVSAFPGRKQLVDLIKSFDPKLLLLDFASDPDRAFTLMTELAGLGINLPVVALLGSNSPDLILRCLRQGATDFLIRPFTPDQLDAAFEKIARLHPPPANGRAGCSKVVAMVPAKGACGATTIACNLAHQARRQGSEKVLLADLDPLTGTVSFLLKLRSQYSFLDVLARPDAIDADLWKQLVAQSQGVDVLLPPENIMEGLDELPDATPILQAAAQLYSTVIVDSGGALGSWHLSIAAAADEVLLVTTNELASLRSAQRVLACYSQKRIDRSKVRILVNRYDREIGLTGEAIAEVLETEVFHTVPSDFDSVSRSMLEGKPIQASSALGKSLTTLAERLLPVEKPRPAEKAKAAGGRLFGLFSRS